MVLCRLRAVATAAIGAADFIRSRPRDTEKAVRGVGAGTKDRDFGARGPILRVSLVDLALLRPSVPGQHARVMG